MKLLSEELAGLEDAELRLWQYHWPDNAWCFRLYTPYVRSDIDPRHFVVFYDCEAFSASTGSVLGELEHRELESGLYRFRGKSVDIKHHAWAVMRRCPF